MVVVSDDVKGPASPAPSTSASSSAKKLKQSTINFFTKDTGKDKQNSPPAKKPKLVVENKPVVVDITEDEPEPLVDNDNDNLLNADDNSVNVHPLSGLVGSALKRKLRKRKTTTVQNETSSNKVQEKPEPVPQESEQLTVADVLKVVIDEPVEKKNDEIKTSKKVEKAPKKPTPKRTRKTAPKNITKSLKSNPKESHDKSSKPSEKKVSESVPEKPDNKSSESPVLEISDDESTELVIKAPDKISTSALEIPDDKPSKTVLEKPDDKKEPVIELTSNDNEDVEMVDATEASDKESLAKEDSDIEDSTDDNNCDKAKIEETQVELKTPKNKKLTASSPRPGSERKLTPKQLQKKLESEKKRQEKEKEKLERDKKRQEEKDERQKLKLEKEELKKKEKEDKEEQKRKEKEEREKQKELERKEREDREESKRKERELKELMKKKDKEAKEEDRKRKEIEKEEEKKRRELEKQEAELKTKKAAAAFVNFFVPKAGTSKCLNDCTVEDNVSKNGLLSMFRIKSDMRLAPTVRHELSHEQKSKLDEILKQEEVVKKLTYLTSLKKTDYCIKTSGKTWPFCEAKEDCVVVEDDLPPVDDMDVEMDNSQKQILRAKLFSFSENRRPPYWGTWRKKSKHINGRRPFGLDKTFLDYECDSDDEWEEEEPGESVGSVAGSDDEDGDNEYDVDNEFMVPHGYLSEEEALDDDDVAISPETQKLKLKLLEDEFENERRKTTERLHPRLLGIIWQTEENGKPDSCSDPVWNFLNKRKMLSVEDTILVQPLTENSLDNDDDCADRPESEIKKKRLKLSEAMIPDLIKLVHGNTNNKGFLCKEFSTFISKTQNINVPEKDDSKENDQPPTPVKSLSKLAIVKKIKEISKWMPCPDEGAMQSKMCWFVEKSIRDKYGLEDLSVPNTWNYILPKDDKRKIKSNLNASASEETKPVVKEPISGKKENGFQITKFTKILSREERDKQFASPKTSTSEDDKQNSETKEKKRVSLLFSGPRGVSLPSSKDTSLPEAEPEKEKTLSMSEPAEETVAKGVRSNLLSQFIKIGDKKRKIDEVLSVESDKDKASEDCVVLSD